MNACLLSLNELILYEHLCFKPTSTPNMPELEIEDLQFPLLFSQVTQWLTWSGMFKDGAPDK